MAFRFQHGNVADVAALGAAAGRAEKAKRLHEQAMRFAMQVQAQKNAMVLAEKKMEFQLQATLQDQAFRANMQNVKNQHDFEFAEQKRMDELGMDHMKEIKRKAGLDNMIQATQDKMDSGLLSREEGERHVLNLTAKYEMGPGAPMLRSQPKDDSVLSLLDRGRDPGDESPEITKEKRLLEHQKAAEAEGKVVMVNIATGAYEKVPRDEVEEQLDSKKYKLPGTNYEEQVEQEAAKQSRFDDARMGNWSPNYPAPTNIPHILERKVGSINDAVARLKEERKVGSINDVIKKIKGYMSFYF